MTRLLPCPSCNRHVRSDAQSCPFCSAALELAPAPLAKPVGRLTRAAVFAGAALAVSACGGSGKTAEGPKLENQPTADAGADMAPAPDAEMPAEVPIDNHAQPMPYGAPPARDRLV